MPTNLHNLLSPRWPLRPVDDGDGGASAAGEEVGALAPLHTAGRYSVLVNAGLVEVFAPEGTYRHHDDVWTFQPLGSTTTVNVTARDTLLWLGSELDALGAAALPRRRHLRLIPQVAQP